MKIKKVSTNNRKKCIDIETAKGLFSLPFAKLRLIPTVKNRIVKIYIDPELANECITYFLESGADDSVPLCAFLDYNKEPEYMRKATLYNLTIKALELLEQSHLSKREVARKLHTSPTQIYRLLQTNNYTKTIDMMLKLITALGYDFEINLKKAA
jgi:hypothetical protein